MTGCTPLSDNASGPNTSPAIKKRMQIKEVTTTARVRAGRIPIKKVIHEH
jgi:hypothetical protein